MGLTQRIDDGIQHLRAEVDEWEARETDAQDRCGVTRLAFEDVLRGVTAQGRTPNGAQAVTLALLAYRCEAAWATYAESIEGVAAARAELEAWLPVES